MIINKIYNTIDLFAGCGGLMEGFMQEGHYNTLACVEWEKSPCKTLVNRLKNKWGHINANEEVVYFDIQRTEELVNGYDDILYGKGLGLDLIIKDKPVDIIIGGPPCQAYSLAGRIRDPHGMRNDYRNYLFESYIKILSHYKPTFFVFENVMGMLSAAPDGKPIVDRIKEAFNNAGYFVLNNFKEAVFEVADYGIPQHRKRIIILGVNKEAFASTTENICESIINDFYRIIMPELKSKAVVMTVRDAIADLPKLMPSSEIIKYNGRKYSHVPIECANIYNHSPRFHSVRDQGVFKLLGEDIESGRNKYTNINALKELYTKVTGKNSNIHKYYVLRWDEPSNTIPAHLYKDGMRHIHPDPNQARSITVREAARLQSFPDDFEFLGSNMAQYKMIGNAVPPLFAKQVAIGVKMLLDKYC